MEQVMIAPIVISAMLCGYMLNEFQRYIQWKKIEEKVEEEKLRKLQEDGR